MSSVRLSICLSVCNVGGSESHRLESLDTNCTDNEPNTFAVRIAQRPSTYSEGNMGKFGGDCRCMVVKSAVLEHKSGNISETCKYRDKVTLESIWDSTNALSNGTIPDPLYGLLFPKIGDSQPRSKIQLVLSQEWVKLRSVDFKFGRYIHRVHSERKPIKHFGEKGP